MAPSFIIITCNLIAIVTAKYGRHHTRISLDEFPNPMDEDGIKLCGRERDSFICDPNQFLSAKSADQIDEIILNATQSNLVWCPYTRDSNNQFIANTNKKTRDNFNGLQVGIAIISSFKSYGHSRLRRDDNIAKKCKIYAKSIHDQWGVGEAGCNNAVMIFVNIYDRYLYVSTGSGIKSIIKDSFIDEFIVPKYVKPLMRASKYGEAIQLIVESIIDVLANSDDLSSHALYQEYVDYTSPYDFLGLSLESWFFGGFFLSAAAYLGWKFHSERDYRECERKLARLYAQKQAKKFASSSCPICLEEFAALTTEDGNERATAILICGHKFCKECLDSWFASQSAANQKCPICRHDRDDWSAAINGGGDEDEKKDEENEENVPLLGNNEEKVDDAEHEENDVDDEKDDGHHFTKSSTSDNFYARDGVEEQSPENGNFGFRRRSRPRDGLNDMNNWMFRQELMFRMMRMRHYYPRYVTNDMTNRWTQADYTGSFTNDQSFRRANPNYRPPASRATWNSGRSRSGFSFGGGSSHGGGGGGGGW